MYIAVDLKVIEGKAAAVARAAGCSEERVGWGLSRLWHRVWCDGTDHLERGVLAGVFGGERLDELILALVTFGFLEALEQRWRVRGASRYLRLKESRREGARKTNAARSKSDALERSRATLPPTLNDALSPSTEHRAPSTDNRAVRSTPPPKDSGAGFFARAQDHRKAHGVGPENPPHPSKLATWYSQAMMELSGDDQRLWLTYDAFTDDGYWRDKQPPWPFQAFIKEWRRYVVREEAAG